VLGYARRDLFQAGGIPMLAHATASDTRTPVILITGFLGSGKTTLLNRLVKTESFCRSAVVVNEYGQTSIDHALIAAPRARMRVIDGGCLCGHVHEEVASALLDLYQRRALGAEHEFDTVLIETSGLADPVPIVQILLTDREIAALYDLQTIVTVADGLLGLNHLQDHEESLKQAAVADVLVLGKSDVASSAALDALSSRLSAVNPGASQVRAAHGMVDAAALRARAFGPSRVAPWLAGGGPARPVFPAAADRSIATFTLEHEHEITLPGFVLWMNLLAGFRGAGLLRVKGIVNVEGHPYAVQAVQTVISEPVLLEAWPDEERRSRLVFITRHMAEEDVRRTFAAFGFDAGRAPRNSRIDPRNFALFKQTIELFRRTGAVQPAHGDQP
jgi:G3E family GTPase